jgi:hypothetical protein
MGRLSACGASGDPLHREPGNVYNLFAQLPNLQPPAPWERRGSQPCSNLVVRSSCCCDDGSARASASPDIKQRVHRGL